MDVRFPNLVTVATCSLNQWALDFDGNLTRVRRSIELAKQKGARYRLGPELELCGYGCEDHYLESDTQLHCWESLAALLADGSTDDCLCDIGMPVVHQNVRYNCRVLCLNGRILLIRPKLFLANDGNYRELRWFQRWHKRFHVEDHALPRMITRVTGQQTVPFGDGAVALGDTVVGCETCEELFTPDAPHIALSLAGVEIIGNGSASHHELRKLHRRIDLMRSGSDRAAAVYLYANQRGCDGGRCYYDGSPLVFANGALLAQGSQFCLCSDVEVVTATINIESIRAQRAARNSRSAQAADHSVTSEVPRVWATMASPPGNACVTVPGTTTSPTTSTKTTTTSTVPMSPAMFRLGVDVHSGTGSEFQKSSGRSHKKRKTLTQGRVSQGTTYPASPTGVQEPRYLTPEQEIGMGPACWLWDYLRRSGMRGFFLALSGGADSAAVAAMVGIMCQLVSQAVLTECKGQDGAAKERSGNKGGAGGDRTIQCCVPSCAAHRSSGYAVLDDLRRITRMPDAPADRWYSPQAVARDLLYTSYMGKSGCSSSETRGLAEQVAAQIGANHFTTTIDQAVDAFTGMFGAVASGLGGRSPQFAVNGGTLTENLALQNVQARSRMVFGYMLAQLLPWAQASVGAPPPVESTGGSGPPRTAAEPGGLLVLGSGNVDEALRGYLTKYDCSSADINPIGAVSKVDLRRFLVWASDACGWQALAQVANATPSAELIPTSAAANVQSDEVEMGMTYEELSVFGRLRSIDRCGPLSMFQTLVGRWGPRGTERQMAAVEVAAKVRRFFHYYAINRHKLTTLTPSYHAEAYSPDDNRHDLRQFLYPRWDRQFRDMNSLAEAYDSIAATNTK